MGWSTGWPRGAVGGQVGPAGRGWHLLLLMVFVLCNSMSMFPPTMLLLDGCHEVLDERVLCLLQLEQCLADLLVGQGWGEIVDNHWHDELLMRHGQVV